MALCTQRSEVKNLILRSFMAAELGHLSQKFEVVELPNAKLIYPAHSMVRHIYFPEKGLISLIKTMKDGRTTEIGVVGIDGFTGLNSLLGIPNTDFETVVQIPGSAYRISASILNSAMEKQQSLRAPLMRYAHYTLSAIAQTAACHRLHSLQERCCRWLLVAHDSAQSDAFPLTHEFLAVLLGVGRSYVSTTANQLRQAGLIRYSRGWVTITDRAGLEGSACECYGAVRAEFNRLFRV